jgi:hypothetical protein
VMSPVNWKIADSLPGEEKVTCIIKTL